MDLAASDDLISGKHTAEAEEQVPEKHARTWWGHFLKLSCVCAEDRLCCVWQSKQQTICTNSLATALTDSQHSRM